MRCTDLGICTGSGKDKWKWCVLSTLYTALINVYCIDTPYICIIMYICTNNAYLTIVRAPECTHLVALQDNL